MLCIDDIIDNKIKSRFVRNKCVNEDSVERILKDCCEELSIDQPNLICCDTLKRSFSAFILRSESYLIYDDCLTESLYLFNAIIKYGNDTDAYKFFYKLFAEELILTNNLAHSLYFSGKYRKAEYSFQSVSNLDEINDQVTRQLYFLIGHELTHLSLQIKNIEITHQFQYIVLEAVRLLTLRFINDGKDEKQVLSEISGYFISNQVFSNIDEYIDCLPKSDNFNHFVEECFCDYQGFKMVIENYSDADISVNSISNALNYLIMQESLRSDLSQGVYYINNARKEAQDTLYFSLLRVQMMIIILVMNDIAELKIAFDQTYECCMLTRNLEHFIDELPPPEVLKKIDDSLLPKMDRTKVMSSVIGSLRYCHLG